jgi:hypothetical protein
VPTVVLLTPIAPSRFAEDLERLGVTVHEALAVSEVLNLVQEHNPDAVVLLHDLQVNGLDELKRRVICFELKSVSTPADVVWELSNLKKFPLSVQ